MLNPRYAFATAYLKGEESKIVTSEHLERMLRVSTLPEAIDIIQDTNIGGYLKEQTINKFEDVDEFLWAYLQEHIGQLERFQFFPDEIHAVLQKHIVKYDILNIKAALQGIVTHKKTRMIPVGIIHSRRSLDKLSEVEEGDGIIGILRRCELGRYADILSQAGDLAAEDLKSRLLLESRLDNAYYQDMLAMARGLNEGPLLTRAFGFIIDLLNLQIILRSIARGAGPEVAEYTISGGYILSTEVIRELLSLKLTDIPGRLENTLYREVGRGVLVNYEKTQSLTAIEEVIDKHKFRLVKEILSPRVMSPLMMAWYLILKEIELRNLRLIAKSLLDNISLEGIRNFLVAPS